MHDRDVLLHGFHIVQVMDCIADPTKNRIIAEFSDNIAAIFQIADGDLVRMERV